MSQPDASLDLLFLDLDGTLIGASGEVDPQLWPDLDRLARAGLPLSVCTGRPWGGVAAAVAQRLGPKTPHIFHGGALVRSIEEVFAAEPVPAAAFTGMIDRAEATGQTLELYTPGAIFVGHHTELSRGHAEAIGQPSEVCDLRELADEALVIKAQWIVPTAELDGVLQADHPGCHLASATSDVMPGISFVTVTRRGVDKGSAARRVAGLLQVSLERAGAVGDSTGDVPVLELVGRPMVMGDAPEELRRRFETLPGVEEHGVLELLRLIP